MLVTVNLHLIHCLRVARAHKGFKFKNKLVSLQRTDLGRYFFSRTSRKNRMVKSTEESDAFSRIHEKTEFDFLLIKLGGWSQFQQIQWLLLFLAAVPQAWYTYAPAFAAAKPKEDQVFCAGNRALKGDAFCAAWQNGTCKEAEYDVPYTSIVTDVS